MEAEEQRKMGKVWGPSVSTREVDIRGERPIFKYVYTKLESGFLTIHDEYHIHSNLLKE